MSRLGRCAVVAWQFKTNILAKRVSIRLPSYFASFHRFRALYNVKGQELKMPSLSPTMTEGTIVRWLKNEGDSVSPGDILCEIQTDKAVVGFEVEEEGVLAKILVPSDTKDVKIGTVIGLMVDTDEDWRSVEIPSSIPSPTEKSSSAQVSQGMAIKMPSLSPTMTEGTVVKWLKKEGDPVAPGDVLCEIQTDKAVVGFETDEEGILAKILIPESTKDVKIGTVIALMVSEGEDWKNVSLEAEVEQSTPSVMKQSTTSQKVKVDVKSSGSDDSPRLIGPSVRNLLQKYGIKYTLVKPTGPHNVLLKYDVIQYIEFNKLKPKTFAVDEAIPSTPDITFIEESEYTDIPHTSMRKTIARRLTESKSTMPHAYMSISCIANEIIRLRSQMKANGIIVSVNDFVIKCAATALSKVPELNVVQLENQVKKVETVDISIAVATEKGLITPIVKQADRLSVDQISNCVKTLAVKAREGRLKPDEYQGGTFSISNLGMFGISEFTAVINPPQNAILAVGTSRLVFTESKAPVTKITVTLSFNRSVIEESDAAYFLQCFKEYIENPSMMSLGVNLKESFC